MRGSPIGLMSDLLHTPLGWPGSGRQRYAVAMGLHRDGLMSDAALEVYRICSPLDRQDPEQLLLDQNLPIPAKPTLAAATALHSLIAAIDSYLATLKGPGVAEVRARLNAQRPDSFTPAAGQDTPDITAHLVHLAQLDPTQPVFAMALRNACPYLHWQPNPGLAQLIGVNGPWVAADFELGIGLADPPFSAGFYFQLIPTIGIYARWPGAENPR